MGNVLFPVALCTICERIQGTVELDFATGNPGRPVREPAPCSFHREDRGRSAAQNVVSEGSHGQLHRQDLPA